MFYFTLGEGVVSDLEETSQEQTTQEQTTESQISTPSDAWTSEKVDKVSNDIEGILICLFFICVILLHNILHRVLLRSTNDIK